MHPGKGGEPHPFWFRDCSNWRIFFGVEIRAFHLCLHVVVPLVKGCSLVNCHVSTKTDVKVGWGDIYIYI